MYSILQFLYVYMLYEHVLMTDFDLILCRMLIPPTELGRFDSMVMPFELEAYNILKSRSSKQRNAFNNTY